MKKQDSYWSLASASLPKKEIPIKDIVYLDQNYRTFKYFLTGEFEDRHEFKSEPSPMSDSPHSDEFN